MRLPTLRANHIVSCEGMTDAEIDTWIADRAPWMRFRVKDLIRHRFLFGSPKRRFIYYLDEAPCSKTVH